jgi:CDP-6-deoxy-D-xylo-4-hexulose-3-dehydrase
MALNSRANDQDRSYRYPLALATYGPEEVLGALDSMVTFRTTMWNKTAEFEAAFDSLFGTGESVMVNSGSSADLLISFALRDKELFGLEPGDEILAPAVTWPTQIWSLVMAGFSVRLVDVDPHTLNMSHEDLSKSIGPRTRAISLVHLMGNTANLDKVREIAEDRNLIIIEDSCEALGTKWRGQDVGTFGVASSSSFFFSHHLMTMEGGMVSTNSPELAEHFRLLRAHGWTRNLKRLEKQPSGIDERYVFENWGFNVRPTELNAAFGIVQLEKYPSFQAFRTRAAQYCMSRIKEMAPALIPMNVLPDTDCSWFAFPILVGGGSQFSRNELTAHLQSHSVETRPIVTGNLAKQPAVAKFPDVRFASLPGADFVHEQGFYIGIHPVDVDEELERVWDVMEDFVAQNH